MSKIIYDVRQVEKGGKVENNLLLKTYGEYGTEDWWGNLEKKGLIRIEEGVVINVFESGHGDNFPEFEIELSGEKFRFERKGDKRKYDVGLVLRVFLVPLESVFNCEHPLTNGFKGKHDLLKVEIL